MKTALGFLFWFFVLVFWGLFGCLGLFFKVVPEYMLMQKWHVEFLPEGFVCTGGEQMPSHV